MSVGALAQIAIDIFLGIGLFVCAMRIARAPKDDPRLSRGLQLLQSKIAVLEDLADRSEAQAQHLTALLDQKSRDIQTRIEDADRHVQAVGASMQRSMEVAKMFEDKIPHHEIIERQNSVKYVTAARLAHDGMEVDEIARRIDLPRGQIEFIAKVNRDRLMFNEAQLPWWAESQLHAEGAAEVASGPQRAFSPPPNAEAPRIAYAPPLMSASESLERLGNEFRRACAEASGFEPEFGARPTESSQVGSPADPSVEPLATQSPPVLVAKPSAPIAPPTPNPKPAAPDVGEPLIRRVVFPRIAYVRPTDNLR